MTIARRLPARALAAGLVNNPNGREPGTLTVEETILLPRRLNQGDYLLHIYLTHPNVCYHAEIENIKLQVESRPCITGKTFEYSAGAGWIALDSKANR